MTKGIYYTVDDVDVDRGRPKYRCHDAPMPLFREERTASTDRDVHLHLHLGGDPNGDPDPDPEDNTEPEGGDEPPETNTNDEPEEPANIAAICAQLHEIAQRCGGVETGGSDNRRRQHTRDSRAVPLPSEISDVIFGDEPRRGARDADDTMRPGMPMIGSNRARPIAGVLDGAEALRERARAEQAALADQNLIHEEFWERQYRNDPQRRR